MVIFPNSIENQYIPGEGGFNRKSSFFLTLHGSRWFNIGSIFEIFLTFAVNNSPRTKPKLISINRL
jgi:hypothetical protein